MADSAILKVDRAAKHVRELSELFRKNRPFTYVIKTNTQTGQRSASTKKNEPVINETALICGDVVHNLRSALDHVYWEIIWPHCTSDKELRDIQFPFTSKASELLKTLRERYAHRAGTGFYSAMRNLRPHGDPGGNEMLALIREADNLDKHRLLIPSVDYTKINGEQFKAALPANCPVIFGGSNVTVTMSSTTINWTERNISPDELGRLIFGSLHLFEREIDLPMEIVLQIGQPGRFYPTIPTLNQMVDAVRETIGIMREGAASY